VRDRRSLIAAHIGHAGLQQSLGDRENALAVEDLAFSEFQQLDLARERPLHRDSFVDAAILGRARYAVDTVSFISCIDGIDNHFDADAGPVNVNDIDLNLLKIFDAVYAERSVSRAAERVGLTQPSVSHGLARLRALFRDLLFVRVKGGVAPTAVAKRIAPALAEALHSVQTVLDDALGFDPPTAERVFRVHMSDLGEMVFLPRDP